MAHFPRRRGPIVASNPPPARRVPIVGGARPPAPVHVVPSEEFARGRVYTLFGPPFAGKTTICRIVDEETETSTAHVAVGSSTLDALAHEIGLLREEGTEVIFLDGLPRDVDDVQWLYDERLVAPGWGGGILRVERNAAFGKTAGLSEIETRILDLSMPYHVVRNDDLEYGVIDVLRRTGIVK